MRGQSRTPRPFSDLSGKEEKGLPPVCFGEPDSRFGVGSKVIQRLKSAVETAYHIFANDQLGKDLIVCRCDVCMDEATERRLVATPLREIPASLLAEYTNSAHGYAEGQIAKELRYFLPRYFELIAHDDPPAHVDGSFALCRLAEARYRETWPLVEAEAVDGFFDALLLDRIAHDQIAPGRWTAWIAERTLQSDLGLMVNAGCDVERVLRTWSQAPDPSGAIHIADLRHQIETVRGGHRIRYALMNFRDAEQRIAEWLKSAENTERLEHAFFETKDARLQQMFSDAIET